MNNLKAKKVDVHVRVAYQHDYMNTCLNNVILPEIIQYVCIYLRK